MKKLFTLETFTGATTVALAAFSFAVSFTALRELASEDWINFPIPILFPIILELAVVIFSVNAMYRSVNGLNARWQWVVIIASSVAAGAFNVIHAEPNVVARVIAGLPSLMLILALETFLSQVKHRIEKSDMKDTVSQLQSMKEGLDNAVSSLVAEKEKLKAELSELATKTSEKASALNELSSTAAKRTDEISELASQVASMKDELPKLQSKRDELQKEIATATKKPKAKRTRNKRSVAKQKRHETIKKGFLAGKSSDEIFAGLTISSRTYANDISELRNDPELQNLNGVVKAVSG